MSKTSKWLIGGIAVIVIGGIAYATLGRNSSKSDDKVVKVGIMSGSKQDAEIWKTVANTAKDKYGITLKFKEFSDYTQPNKALADGDIDLNAFQHYSFLNASTNPLVTTLLLSVTQLSHPFVCIQIPTKNCQNTKKVTQLQYRMTLQTKVVHCMS